MSFIKFPKNVNTYEEPKAVPGGKEYDLTVVYRKDSYVKPESGNTVLPLGLRIDDYPDAPLVNHALVIPPEGHEYEDLMMRGVRRFLHTFNIDIGDGEGINDESVFDGAQGRCLLTEEEYEGEMQNKLKLPPVPDE